MICKFPIPIRSMESLHAVWERTGIKQETKLKVYCCLKVLSCLRKLLWIKWKDRIPDTEVLSKANIPSIYTMLGKEQLLVK